MFHELGNEDVPAEAHFSDIRWLCRRLVNVHNAPLQLHRIKKCRIVVGGCQRLATDSAQDMVVSREHFVSIHTASLFRYSLKMRLYWCVI